MWGVLSDLGLVVTVFIMLIVWLCEEAPTELYYTLIFIMYESLYHPLHNDCSVD